MKRLLIALSLIAFVLPAVNAQTIASFPTWNAGDFVTGTRAMAAFDKVMKKETPVITPYTVAASDSQTISGINSMIHLTPSTGSAASNTANVCTVATSTATEGQMNYIFNSSATAASILDADGTSVGTCSADTGILHMFFIDGKWRLLEDQ
jgi:hypothetical protein